MERFNILASTIRGATPADIQIEKRPEDISVLAGHGAVCSGEGSLQFDRLVARQGRLLVQFKRPYAIANYDDGGTGQVFRQEGYAFSRIPVRQLVRQARSHLGFLKRGHEDMFSGVLATSAGHAYPDALDELQAEARRRKQSARWPV